jgi:hypothetical protein
MSLRNLIILLVSITWWCGWIMLVMSMCKPCLCQK